MNEDHKLAEDVKKSNTKIRECGLGGYLVISPIDDWDKLDKELERSKKIVNNLLNEKEVVFRDSLIILMKSVEVKTLKTDYLIQKLEEMR